ncbi:hypothetical protein NC797_01810 [Aquibacillus sp. 3ASR75-11]|uniref:Uncharacterized protein n=1 Tax=Terrihalobacillus insolitus TaxID=2950438 RepID=A0A9X3WR96_9BACI|nr:hypothetical protein [Terrihalobacillus insolitus]MDC3412064.1 hypothetical protein [Terrihalobacillus insolitus]MDC3423243.1 hypothetical protein [Terrihalobacillus insolitus]
MTRLLFLNEQEILQTVSMKDMIDTVDESYRIYEEQPYLMPTRTKIQF